MLRFRMALSQFTGGLYKGEIHNPLYGSKIKLKQTICAFTPSQFYLEGGIRKNIDKYFEGKLSTKLSVKERLDLCLQIGSECIKPEELETALLSNKLLISYDGFEPSGRMHIAQGFMKVFNTNTLAACGIGSVMWIADYYAMLNNKLNGNLTKIRIVGEYFIHVWKAAGMDTKFVKFLWASEEIERYNTNYWNLVMDISCSFNISRIKRCSQALGRVEGDDQPLAQLMYSAMQCADILYIGADICQLGVDQRKINMLAREYVEQKKLPVSPIIISHEMLPGLIEGQAKMSKSCADSAIFMEDSEEQVKSKIKKAFCPPCVADSNPCLAYFKQIVFPKYQTITVTRARDNGGDITFNSYREMERIYIEGKLHPMDLKNSLSTYLNQMLQPVRDYFKTNAEASKLVEIINSWK